MVKRIAETKIATGTRVRDDELYPIKVDFVRWTAVWEEKEKYRSQAAEELSSESETTVAKIKWLSDQESPKTYGSMAVYLTKGLISEGYFHAGGEPGNAGVFKPQSRPHQCYKYQQIVRHKASECENILACGRCAKEGHHHKKCRETVLKCIPCGGPHESFSKKCPKLYLSIHE
ncbi:hypothetical protein QIS74_13653 [Colletotrichum tabaci]|uniref:CCHC-type domain-containing protein n=1 Tax=Colletotrichum tabaci TaxID=1209068 RepID=A0AAV9STB8_9PEZI